MPSAFGVCADLGQVEFLHRVASFSAARCHEIRIVLRGAVEAARVHGVRLIAADEILVGLATVTVH